MHGTYAMMLILSLVNAVSVNVCASTQTDYHLIRVGNQVRPGLAGCAIRFFVIGKVLETIQMDPNISSSFFFFFMFRIKWHNLFDTKIPFFFLLCSVPHIQTYTFTLQVSFFSLGSINDVCFECIPCVKKYQTIQIILFIFIFFIH